MYNSIFYQIFFLDISIILQHSCYY